MKMSILLFALALCFVLVGGLLMASPRMSEKAKIALDAAILKDDWLLHCAGNAEQYGGSFDGWWRMSRFHEDVQKFFKDVAPNEPVPSKEQIGERVREIRSVHRVNIVEDNLKRTAEVSSGIERLWDQMEDAEAKRTGIPKWPGALPPDKDHPHMGGHAYVGGLHYKKQEVSPGKWQWVEDVEFMRERAEEWKRKCELLSALRTRVLTDAEMAEVAEHGDSLNIKPEVSYYAEEKTKELRDAMMQQFRLRAAANKSADPE